MAWARLHNPNSKIRKVGDFHKKTFGEKHALGHILQGQHFFFCFFLTEEGRIDILKNGNSTKEEE